MTDLEGKLIRDVAGADVQYRRFSPAAWSPDGRWIAYLRQEPNPQAKDEEILVSLLLQEADSGKERVIFQTDVKGVKRRGGEELPAPLGGPQWVGDSRTLLIRSMDGEPPGIVMLNLEGKPTLQLPLKDELASVSAAVSPDGKSIAYLRMVRAEGVPTRWEVYVHDVQSGHARRVGHVTGEGSPAYPAWSADSRFVYLGGRDEEKARGDRGFVRRIDVETGDGLTVWEGPNAFWTVSVSADTGQLCVAYALGENLFGMDIVEPKAWQATPLHFSRGFGWPTISPDGRWVALVTWADRPKAIGVIMSADGTELRCFVPEDESRDAMVLEFLRSRLDSTLRAIWWGEEDRPRPARKRRRPGAPSGAAVVKRAHEILDRVAREQEAPVFQEAVAYGHVAIYPWLLKHADPGERGNLVPEAREHLAALLRAYPDHPLGPVLGKQLDELLTP